MAETHREWLVVYQSSTPRWAMADGFEQQHSTLTAVECHGSVDSVKSELVCFDHQHGRPRPSE